MSTPSSAGAKPSFANRFLGTVERVGNALPHPATMFAALAGLVVLLSWAFSAADVQVVNPANGQAIKTVNLFSAAGIQRMLNEAVRNFINFPPLGVSLVALLGIGVAEHSGLIGAALRLLVLNSPRRLITPMVVFVGVMSNAGSEVGYVLVTPLGAALFHALGRHPLTGLAAAFAGVSGGYSANLLIGSVDVLLAGLTEAAAKIVDPSYVVRPTANWYFMMAATFVLTAAGTWVTEKIVAKRLGDYAGDVKRESLQPLSALEKRGLWAALTAVAALVGLIAWGVAPAGGFLDAKSDRFTDSAFMTGLVTFIFLFAVVPGIAYGFAARTLKNDHDVMSGMIVAMRSLASYLVLAFFAAQFIAYFNWTNLGVITAVSGAQFIKSIGLQDSPILLMIALVLFTGAVNILISSASAKWALLAPVFVPMFMLLGYSPELVMGTYRIGDSVTNIVTPMMSYFPLILTFLQKYEPKGGVGTLVALMLPYSVTFLVIWVAMLAAWMAIGLPVGPGAPLYLKP